MRILHLFANWKWTGPAEPAVNLAENKSFEVDTEFPLIAPVNAYDMLPDYLKSITDM